MMTKKEKRIITEILLKALIRRYSYNLKQRLLALFNISLPPKELVDFFDTGEKLILLSLSAKNELRILLDKSISELFRAWMEKEND